ncbi:MAG: redoxin domain-containing protein [Lysobacter sp.]|nr:MAG: redoxin domain-containing protein [Lysobacter sp.]
MTRWRMGVGVGMLGAVCALSLTMAASRAAEMESDAVVGAPSPLAIGDRIDASLFCEAADDDWRDSIKLIVLAPARSEYDGMLKLAFREYFRNGAAFPHDALKTPIKVVYATGVRAETGGGFMGDFAHSDCTPATDPQALTAIAHATGVTLPLADDSDATVLLLDRDGTLRWRDTAYRAQGEHLKPLEKTVKALLGVSDAVARASDATLVGASPRVGDLAPDFEIPLPPPAGSLQALLAADAQRPAKTVPLSSLRGKVVLLTFYPAAFSGTLPTVQGSVADKVDAERKEFMRKLMSCSIQIGQLDKLSQGDFAEDDIVKLAVSASTPQLLDSWRRLLGTTDMRYVNDPDYAIAQRYGSYDAAAGYDLRKVFVIGRDGRVAYVDEDYAAGDGDAVQAALARAARETSAAR